MGQLVPVLLGDSDAITEEELPSFDAMWSGTNALLEWIVAASPAACQPSPLEVIAESSRVMNPAAPTAEQLVGDGRLDNAEAEDAFVRDVLLCAVVMASYLLACPLERLTAISAEPVGSVVPLEADEVLTSQGLCKLVLLCAPCKEVLAEIVAPFLDEAAPLDDGSGFVLTFTMKRLFTARALMDYVRTMEIANALGVEPDHSAVQRMLTVSAGAPFRSRASV